MPNNNKINIAGRLLDSQTQKPLPGLKIEAWDGGGVIQQALASSISKGRGDFDLSFDRSELSRMFQSREPALALQILRGNTRLVHSAKDVLWQLVNIPNQINILVDLQNDEVNEPWLRVDSFETLLQHEQPILARINALPNGGNLFMVHPFLLLRDLGVELSQQTRVAILERVPSLTGLSSVPYDALKTTSEPQRIQVHLQGLFPRSVQ